MVSLSSFTSYLTNQASSSFSSSTSSSGPFVLNVKDINTSGGQCSWCGKYGHQRGICPYLK